MTAISVFGSLVAATMKRRVNWRVLQQTAEKTLLVSCLIFWIVDAVLALKVSRYVVLVVIMLMLIVMGMVIDTVGIIMIAVPVFVPIITSLGFDPTWFGVLFIINMEIGFLTPPFGYNLFYLKGVAPRGVKLTDIYRSITPFVLLMILGLGICIAIPEIILYLPSLVF